MYITLMLLTVLAVLLLVGVLTYYLTGIIRVLTQIGGDGQSLLARLRLGLRAIEQETGHLPVQVTKLNENLGETAGGLKMIDNQLTGTIDAVVKQQR